MTVRELYDFFNEKIPPYLSEEGDGDGLMCCPTPEKEVSYIIFALDVTDNVIDEAIKKGAEVIISHHPIIYKGLLAVNQDDFVSAKIIKLIKNDIAVFSFHTRLDAIKGGVNDILCDALGIELNYGFGGESGFLGRAGYLPHDTKIDDFANLVKEKLNCDKVIFSDCGKPVRHIAILGGKGSNYISDAISIGADTYLSGELGYHNMNDSEDFGINLIEAGHFFTENPVCEKLAKIAKKANPNIKYEIIDSYTVKSV